MRSKYKTQLICINKKSSVREAREIMNERRIRHLPVVDDSKNILGIVSRYDLTDIAQFQDVSVELFATKPVEYVKHNTSLRQVALSMLEKRISSVLIVDDLDEVIGIITTNDLLYHLAELLKSAEHHTVKSMEDVKDKDESSKDSILSIQSLIPIGEFSQKLSDIGI